MNWLEFVSVSATPRREALAPAYWLISWRSCESSPGSCAGALSAASAPVPLGYQWTMTKSTELPAMDSTVRFQSALSPSATAPSGQLPGRVSTAPTLTVGSTAFIAVEYWTTLFAYVVGLLLAWLSASQS